MERTPSPAPTRRRFALAATLLLALAGLASCDQGEAPIAAPDVPATTPAAPPPDREPEPLVVPAAVSLDGTPCADIAAISHPPTMVGKRVEDPVYEALKAEAVAAVPCLLDAMASVEPLEDPQKMPGSTADFTVGDLAFFLLIDFGVVDFAQALPPDVSQATLVRGPFAYFDWIVQPGNRERLQARVRRQVEARAASPAVATRG